MGDGLMAGYRTSGEATGLDLRGFWPRFAMELAGDDGRRFATTKTRSIIASSARDGKILTRLRRVPALLTGSKAIRTRSLRRMRPPRIS